jgi:hypothetical protein
MEKIENDNIKIVSSNKKKGDPSASDLDQMHSFNEEEIE